MQRERTYIAGPYSAFGNAHDIPRKVQRNIETAITFGNYILLRGHYVFVPHLSHYQHIHRSMTRDLGEAWYEIDNTFLDHWATALFFIARSKGVDMEIDRAKKRGLPIYHGLNEIPVVPEFGE